MSVPHLMRGPRRSSPMPTVVVGGGLGGLSAAIYLALQGRSVLLYEKNERVGGKLNLHSAQGYTFDTGPSLLTMPWVLHDLFAAAGRNLHDYLELVPVDPICRYRWLDGTQFDAWQQLPRLIHAIEELEPADVQGLFRFLAYSSQIYSLIADRFLLHPFSGVQELFSPQMLRNGPRIDALRTMDSAVRDFFRSPYLRQVFNRYATYNGSSPYRTPATFNVIAYIEFAEGGWYVRGGMYQLARALLRLAEEVGVTIHTNCAVQQVLLDPHKRQVRGVCLADGTEQAAAQVIINADPRYAYTQLLPEQPAIRRTAHRLAQQEASCSGYVLLLGVARHYPQLAHHNIFFSHDYPREFAAIFEQHVPPADPTIYINASCVTDAEHAPDGHMNLFVLVNAPAANGRVNWSREAHGYRNIVLHRLEQMGLTNLSEHIAYERIITPCDFEQWFYAAGGAIYGSASNEPFAAFARPPLRAREAHGLYFTGGGTHPGGGIPLVLLSGRAVAQQVQADQS